MSENRQSPPVEELWAEELAFLSHYDSGAKPPGWQMTPRSVITFLTGSDGEKLKLSKKVKGCKERLAIQEKFVGPRALIERSVITLAGQRGLLLVGEPGTAKSMLSELLAAAISGTSDLTVQGTAGTTEDQMRYGWNYALLIAKGPSPEALVPSPVLTAMTTGRLVRIEEITRCLPEVQDALVSILSDRRISVPELGDARFAAPGFNVIATANLRDRGVSEMSAALKRRFNFELVAPIASLERECALVKSQAQSLVARAGNQLSLDDAVLEALVTIFRDLRNGKSLEGWPVEKPSTVMSTAEAVSVASSLGLAKEYLAGQRDPLSLVPEYLLGVVMKDEPKDRARLLTYWDTVVSKRAEENARLWKQLAELRPALEEVGV